MWPMILLHLLSLLSCLVNAKADTISLTLPWGTWTSEPLDSNGIYNFYNVRFGRDMSGEWRFSKSTFPDAISDPSQIQTDTGAKCIQAQVLDQSGDPLPCIPGGSPGFAHPTNTTITESEDCLFLDLYVPKQAYQNSLKGIHNTPVVVWIYGGAYIFGSKDQSLGSDWNDPFYGGTGPIVASDNNLIFVAGNYRLGAFGWLAGPTMEKQAFPNAGLSDQRLLFEWTQKYIHLVGGDNTAVSAWGESAGASSISWHLVARDEDGKLRDPLFHRAAIQSPAYEWIWDDRTMESTYLNFTKALNCPYPCSVNDMRAFKKDDPRLREANQELTQEFLPCDGLFPLGPSLDHKVLTQLTPVAFSGKPNEDFWVLDSIIVSHVTNEAASFIPEQFQSPNEPNETTTIDFLHDFIPEDKFRKRIQDILKKYPSYWYWWDQASRVKHIIQDAVFVCNTRYMYEAYQGTTTDYYAMTYDFPLELLAKHTYDLPALFWTAEWDMVDWMMNNSKISWLEAEAIKTGFDLKHVPKIYQNYWTSHARFGDPNAQGGVDAPTWEKASTSWPFYHVDSMSISLLGGWEMAGDWETSWDYCGFWNTTAFEVMNLVSPSVASAPAHQQATLEQTEEL